MISLLPSVLVLRLAASVALTLTLRRRSDPEEIAQQNRTARALAVTTVVQGVHFVEEAVTGVHEQFGPLVGLPGMPLALFVAFKLMWLGIWIASIPGLRSGRPGAFFGAWFLAIAGMVNGVAHPLLAVIAGGYFPGVASSSFVALAGGWLWIRLHAATRTRGR